MVTDEIFLQIVQAMAQNNTLYFIIGLVIGWMVSSARIQIGKLQGLIHGITMRLQIKTSDKEKEIAE